MKKNFTLLLFLTISLSIISTTNLNGSWLDDLFKNLGDDRAADQYDDDQYDDDQYEPEPRDLDKKETKAVEKKVAPEKKSNETAKTIELKLKQIRDGLVDINNLTKPDKLTPQFREQMYSLINGKKREEKPTEKEVEAKDDKDKIKKVEKKETIKEERTPFDEYGAVGFLILLDKIIDEPEHQIYKNALAGPDYLDLHKKMDNFSKKVSDLKSDYKKLKKLLKAKKDLPKKVETEKDESGKPKKIDREKALGVVPEEEKTPEDKERNKFQNELKNFYDYKTTKAPPSTAPSVKVLSIEIEKVFDDKKVKEQIAKLPKSQPKDYYNKHSSDYDSPDYDRDRSRRWEPGDDYGSYSPHGDSDYGQSWDSSDWRHNGRGKTYARDRDHTTTDDDDNPSALLRDKDKKKKKKDKKEKEKPEQTNILEALKKQIELIKKISSGIDISKAITDEKSDDIFKKALINKYYDISDLIQINSDIEKLIKTKEGQEDSKKKEYENLIKTRDKTFVQNSQKLKMLANIGLFYIPQDVEGNYSLVTKQNPSLNDEINQPFESQGKIKSEYKHIAKRLSDFQTKELLKQENSLKAKITSKAKESIKNSIDSFSTNSSKLDLKKHLLEIHHRYAESATRSAYKMLEAVLTAKNFGISLAKKDLSDIKIADQIPLLKEAEEEIKDKFSPILWKALNRKQVERAKNYLEAKGRPIPTHIVADTILEKILEEEVETNKDILEKIRSKKPNLTTKNLKTFVIEFMSVNLSPHKNVSWSNELNQLATEIQELRDPDTLDKINKIRQHIRHDYTTLILNELKKTELILREFPNWWTPTPPPDHGFIIIETIWSPGQDSINLDQYDERVVISLRNPETCDTANKTWQESVNNALADPDLAVPDLSVPDVIPTGRGFPRHGHNQPGESFLIHYKFKNRSYIRIFRSGDGVVLTKSDQEPRLDEEVTGKNISIISEEEFDRLAAERRAAAAEQPPAN